MIGFEWGLPNHFFEGFSDSKVDDVVAFDGLAAIFFAEGNYLFVGDFGKIEGAET